MTAARQRPIAVPRTCRPHPTLTREARLSPSPQAGRGRDRRSGGGGADASRPRSTAYLRDPAEISRRSFALIREEADLARFPRTLEPLALRLAHAAGDSAILGDLAWSKGAVAAGRKALAAGAPILVDSAMVAAGITIDPNRIVCTLRDPETAAAGRGRADHALGRCRRAMAAAFAGGGGRDRQRADRALSPARAAGAAARRSPRSFSAFRSGLSVRPRQRRRSPPLGMGSSSSRCAGAAAAARSPPRRSTRLRAPGEALASPSSASARTGSPASRRRRGR